MADNEIKIKVVVDDSQEKKYYSESESRRKKSTTAETEEERRKTASLKAELNERYRALDASLEKERIARQQNKELAVKQAIEERKRIEGDIRKSELALKTALQERVLNLKSSLIKEHQAIEQGNALQIKATIEARKIKEAELRKFEQEHKASLQRQNFDYFQAQKQQVREQASLNTKFAKQQRLPEMGSVGFLSQITSEQKRFSAGSQDWKNLEIIRQGTIADLKKAGVEVSSLSQKIGGQFKNAISEATSGLQSYGAGLIGVIGAQKLFNLSLESARFETLKANFQGTTEDIELFRKATSGTVDDASLIKLSNQASDLGVGLEQQAILFSLAEDAADKYGTSVEEGFQKVVYATEGNTKGLKMLGIQKAEYEETVKKLALAHGKEIEQLDAETQKEIRLQAILQLSGKTIDDVKNKVQDSADKHEQFIVVVKNLSLVYGGDLFNAVTGVGTAYRIVTEAVSKLSTVTEIQKNIILSSVSAWQNLTAQIPIVGDAISWLADRYRDLAGAQSQTAERTFTDAGEDFVQSFDPNYVESPTRKGSNANVNKKSGTGSSKVQTQKEILNLVELEKIKLADLEKKLQANLGHLGSELQIRKEILDVQLKILELETGRARGLNAMPEGSRSARDSYNSFAFGAMRGRFIGVNPRAGNDPRGDMSSEELEALLNGAVVSFEDIVGIASQTEGFFQNILGLAGATNSEFAKILNQVMAVLNAGKSGFDLFSTILGFIPGGSTVGGAIGAVSGGSINPLASGMSSKAPIVINIPIKGTLDGQKFMQEATINNNIRVNLTNA